MIPAPAGSEPGGFEMGPEVYLLALGVVATLILLLLFVWLLRRMIKEDREEEALRRARAVEHEDVE